MSQIITKLRMCRICLMSFILLCSIFTSEYVFSREWQKDNMKVYKPNEESIIFEFQFYDYLPGDHDMYSYLNFCDIRYSEDGSKYTDLIKAQIVEYVPVKDVMWMKMNYIKSKEKIEFPFNLKKTVNGLFYVGGRLPEVEYSYYWISSRAAHLTILWTLPKSIKTIKSIKLLGLWTVHAKSRISKRIEEVYPLKIVKSNSNTMKKDPSELKSEISDNVMITGEAAAISINGVKTGEQIHVYNPAGVEVKSVVANDNIEKIKLHKNKNYVIKRGEVNYKLAL